MPNRDSTSIGGRNEGFETTHWTEIVRAREADGTARDRAVASILGQYWKPVYCYLRRKGYGNEKAKDLTQGFFCDIVLERKLIERADREKGKFRTFLLTALNHYAISLSRAERAEKRMPRNGLIALDGADSAVPEPRDDTTPQEAFQCAWAASLLGDVLKELEAGCRADGLAKHWEVFHATVVQPILDGEKSPPLRRLCGRFGIESETKAYNMSVTVKRRFQAGLARRVRRYVNSDSEVQEEIREMMAALAKRPRA